MPFFRQPLRVDLERSNGCHSDPNQIIFQFDHKKIEIVSLNDRPVKIILSALNVFSGRIWKDNAYIRVSFESLSKNEQNWAFTFYNFDLPGGWNGINWVHFLYFCFTAYLWYFLTFSYFYFLYFILHGPMRVISITWKYHSIGPWDADLYQVPPTLISIYFPPLDQ